MMKGRIRTIVRAMAWVAVAALGWASAPAADTVPARWEAHQIRFNYHGFTTDYTCSGIKGKLRILLRALGARDDVRITGACGGDPQDPQPFFNLKLAFSVPVPAEGAQTAETFPARWEQVEIRYNRPHDIAWGDCELVEQFRDQVLPLFPLQSLDDRTRCVPGQHSVGSPRMTLSVLMPVEGEAITDER